MDRADFLGYWARVHDRSRRVLALLPERQLGWQAREDGFSLGALARHLATSERHLFVETALHDRSTLPGPDQPAPRTKAAILAMVDQLHAESVGLVEGMPAERWSARCRTPGGTDIRVDRWLQLMLEHEIHHRGQLYLMLGMLGIPTPPLYGLTAEQVQEVSHGPPPTPQAD